MQLTMEIWDRLPSRRSVWKRISEFLASDIGPAAW